jgi:hypothetical protein
MIQGQLPKPAELDIYLGDTGLYYRLANQPEPVPIVAGDNPAELDPEPAQTPGIPLYTF